MAGNANTIRQQVAGTIQLTLAPLLGSTITTTKTSFQLNNNAISLTGGGVIPLAAGVTGLYAGTGQVLLIRGTGSIAGATAATTTLLLDVYEIPASVIAAGLTPTSFTNWNEIAVSGNPTIGTATTIAETTSNFSFAVKVQLSSNGVLTGTYTGTTDNQVWGADGGLQNLTTTITGLTGEADLNFAVVATLGGAETGVVLTLDEFAIDFA